MFLINLMPLQASPASLNTGLSPSSPLWKSGSRTAGHVESFSLPPMLTMLLADVDAGSNTPSMVKSVLKWKASDSDSKHQHPCLPPRLDLQFSVQVTLYGRRFTMPMIASKQDLGSYAK